MIPKVELHCHIEGAAKPDLVRKLAKKYGEDLSRLFDDSGNYHWWDFKSFLDTYDVASSVFRKPEDYEELSYSYFFDAAGEGAIYCEIFISPDHAERAGLGYELYVDGLAQGLERAQKDTGIEGRMIAIGVRHFGVEAVESVIRTVTDHPHPLVTGFGLAGEENYGNIRDYVAAFSLAKEAGLSITAHAGEFGGPQSVIDTLNCLGVTRLGHGVRSIEDPNLVARLVEEKIVLELCPGSNVAMGLYDSLEFHPIAQLKQAGVAITISSDDPPHFNSSVGKEYDSIQRTFGWSDAELSDITRIAIEAAFCDDSCRDRLRSKI